MSASSSTTTTTTTDYRLSVLSRIVAASVGGYVLVTMSHLALTTLLPVDYYKALLFSMQTGFISWTLIIIWAFAARTATRAWHGLALVALPLAIIDASYFINGGAL
jgi:hypothetical protein